MENFLIKIRELEKEAEKFVQQQQRDRENVLVAEEVFSFLHWISDLRAKASGWTARRLVVLSLFDGIGGIWTALSLLGIPFTGYSCEVNDAASQVVKARHPMVRHVGNITTLQLNSIPEKVDVIVGGFPCQDLTSLGHKAGLHGQRSKLFFEMLRIIKLFNPTWFFAENVASMAWQDRDEISKHLNTIPIEIDSQELTPSRRVRLYWSNIPYPKQLPQLRDHKSTSLQSVLKCGTALNAKVGCILSQNSTKGHKTSLDLVMDNSTCTLRYMSITEVEKAMGYPAGYTDINFKSSHKNLPFGDDDHEQVEHVPRNGSRTLRSRPFMRSVPQIQRVQSRLVGAGGNLNLRWSLLGNTFSVNVIAYLLSPLLRTVREVPKSIVLPNSISEQDCSAMEPGEVWALYNNHERPNWYALIVSRTGDRFDSCAQVKGKKSPIHIEVRFMEMTDAYAAEEIDEWDAVRGTGLFRVRTVIDSQTSWVTFSHRIDSYWKFDESLYFIFPATDEVWAVYDSVAHSRYLVYVVESYVDMKKAKVGKPGQESFYARCRLMGLVETELYRVLDKEIIYTELSLFAFKTAYIFRNEGTLLKIDLTTRQRAAETKYVHPTDSDTDVSDSKDSSDSDPDACDSEDDEILDEEAALGDKMGEDDLC